MESGRDLYDLEWATDAHVTEILSFMYENFDKEETVLKSLRGNSHVTAEIEESIRLDHERLIRAILSSSPCVVALEKSVKKIIGVNLMIISRNPRDDSTADGVSVVFSDNAPETPIMRRYFDYLSDIGDTANLYERFPSVEKAVEFYAVAVDKKYRKLGIARALMEAGISYARTTLRNVGLVFGVYTSLYSKKAAERLGLRSVMDVDLLTYRDDDGQAIFQDTPPHNIVSVMALELARTLN